MVDALQAAYAGRFNMPPRQVFLLDDEPSNHDAFAVLPSWNDELIAVKSFTYFPENPSPEFSSLYSKIMLFDRKHGEPLALVDGTSVTFWRTAGISGLASRLLSREDSKTLLLLGTGNLAPYIIKAQLSVRPIDRVMIWGRTPGKAQAIVKQFASKNDAVEFEAVDDLQAACRDADIIVSATGSHDPLVLGDWVNPGTHTDFIGNHHATKRECDTALVKKSKVYADSYVNCFKEAGEVLVPIDEGAITEDHVVGELTQMCCGAVKLRETEDEITLFKSIGMAMSDLVGAGAAYRAMK